MIIQPTSLAALTWLGAASGTTAESWRIGVVMSARPLGVSEQGKMVLQIGGMAVEADMPASRAHCPTRRPRTTRCPPARHPRRCRRSSRYACSAWAPSPRWR